MPGGISAAGSDFAESAERYDAWYDSPAGRVLFDCELAALRPLLAEVVGRRLEIGVGSGRFAAALGVDIGIDLLRGPLHRARARGVCVVQGDGARLPFAAGSFGAAVVVSSLCFAPDPAGQLAEVRCTLRSDGRLVLGTVPLNSPWGHSYAAEGRPGHRFYREARFQTHAEITRLLAGAGLRVVTSRSNLRQSPTSSPVREQPRTGIDDGAGFVARAAVPINTEETTQ